MRTRALLLLALALSPLAACDSDGDLADTLFGPTAAVGDGTARTFVRTGADGQPEALGVVLSGDALDGLPMHGGHEENMTTLRLPTGAPAPFDHVSLDWNPHGHEPDGLFTLPHFDVHSYWVSEAERATWTPADPQFAEKGARAPDAEYVPAGYALPPGPAVPMMGNHLVDTADPTYAPGGPAFSEVFIWGSYDGRVVFAEPMITTAFLEALPSHGDHVETLAQPEAWAKAGLYPTRYAVRYDADRDEYTIALEGLTARTAS